MGIRFVLIYRVNRLFIVVFLLRITPHIIKKKTRAAAGIIALVCNFVYNATTNRIERQVRRSKEHMGDPHSTHYII